MLFFKIIFYTKDKLQVINKPAVTTTMVVGDIVQLWVVIKIDWHVSYSALTSDAITSWRGVSFSLSPSILTLITPDLSTMSWMLRPFLPMTFAAKEKILGHDIMAFLVHAA